MRSSPLKQLIIGISIFIIILIIGLLYSIKSSKELNNNFYLVDQTYLVIETVKEIELDLSRAESNARAFYISNDSRFYTDYELLKESLWVDFRRLDSLVSNNKIQNQNIAQLDILLKQRINLFKITLARPAKGIPADSVILINSKIKNVNQKIVKIERDQLSSRQETSYATLYRAQMVIVFSGLVSIAISIIILLLIRRDMERRRQNELDLIKLNENKNKFFSIISHDLRGPVKGIAAMCKALIDSKLSAGINDYLLVMHSSAQTTSNLLDNLLTWSQSQMNKITFHPIKFNLKDVIQENINAIVNLAAGKNIDMKYSLSKDFIVKADKKMIETVTRNILYNALKFTMPGGVISIDMYAQEGNVVVAIADTGIGIPESLSKKLFTINSKVVRTGTSNEQGTGLGLILCKDFIEKNDGKIWVESVEDKGTTFYYSLKIVNQG
jgi:signal transduction histidine kinase